MVRLEPTREIFIRLTTVSVVARKYVVPSMATRLKAEHKLVKIGLQSTPVESWVAALTPDRVSSLAV